jgi:beta-lactam-binding protein with PASTA domain/tRNA A-37 threonylcarbamoyl transferase component Bud32
MDDTLTDPLTGRLLDGRYAVSARIAHGGMATVYLALDTRLDRQVALKVMHADLARDDEFVHRFISEAKSVARLSHQNVVAVYDQGADGPFLYLAMEYVPGRTLKDVLNERGRFSPAEALDIMSGVLDGLAAAHASGIVHRDIKPENVLLTADGRLKVADFGLARAHAAATHTRTGVIIGTVAYLAPELVTGAVPIGPRSDVYSAGVLLFELLTGHQPFTGETPISVAYQHANSDVPAPSEFLPGLPRPLDDLVLAATSRDPSRRPADAAQFLRAVRQVREGLGAGPSGPVQGPPRSGLTGMMGAGVQGMAEAPWLEPGGRPGGTAGWAADQGGQQSGWATDHGGQSGWHTDPGSRPLSWAADQGGGQPGYGGQPASHTMVVHREDTERYLRGRESFLGRWLFSRRLIAVALTLAVIAVVGIGGWWLTSGRYASIPNVTGDSLNVATTALSTNGFHVVKGSSVDSNTVAAGLVVSTSPSGRTIKGTTVTVHLSAGPFTSEVPAVKGEKLTAAEAALAAVHLSYAVQKVGSSLPVGTVVSTDPAAGASWPQTKPVEIQESGGLALPNFKGMQESAVQTEAGTLNIHLVVQQDSSSNQPQNTVLSQTPVAGTIITAGESVTITVSNGPPEVTIPNVMQESVALARLTLEAEGFKVVVTGADFFGQVYDEDPDPGTQAPFGSTVHLFANGFGNGGGGGGGGGGTGGNGGGGNGTPFG